MISALLAVSMLIAPPASPEGPQQRARISLVSEYASVAPGSTFSLGVRFDIDDQWHIYWNGVNDSGQPPKITWTLPPGWTASEFRWPAPTRHAVDIVLDHIYEDGVTLLTTITVPKDYTGPADIKADGTWMICKDVCLIQRGSAELSLTCSATPVASPDGAAIIRDAQSRVPKPLADDPDARKLIQPITEPGGKAADTIRKGFVVPGATRLEFYPADACPALADLLAEGSVKADRILLTLAEPAETVKNRPLIGVLAVWFGNFPQPAYYQVE
ncbi:MAG: hypothetical protein L6Q35_08815 [Phycisphaerales bacterium]|nr:hypothetical protein [Phycisphaerales bacterium]